MPDAVRLKPDWVLITRVRFPCDWLRTESLDRDLRRTMLYCGAAFVASVDATCGGRRMRPERHTA